MGKRRHTVHSGTKALYKRNSKTREEDDRTPNTRPTAAATTKYSRESDEDEDDLDQPFLKFDDEKQDDGDIQVEGMTDVENVMDLGLDMSDSEDEDDDDDENEDSFDDQEEEEEEEDDDAAPDLDYYSSLKDKIDSVKNNVLDWGQKKKNYYHGDTADLELGQEMEDAELEEEAGREVLKARLQRMEESDFYLDDEEEEKNVDSKKPSSKQKRQEEERAEAILSVSSKRTNTKLLSTREKKRVLQKQHPELFPLMQHFRDNVIRPCVDETLVVQKALLQDKDTMQVRKHEHVV